VGKVQIKESLPHQYTALYVYVCACVTGLRHSALYRFGRFAVLDSAVMTYGMCVGKKRICIRLLVKCGSADMRICGLNNG